MNSPVYVLPLYPVFHDLSGKPLEGGSIYIGDPGFAPESRPLAVYWDEANTLPAAQPIKTIAGYPSRNGSQAAIYVSGDYSITVRDKEGRIVYSALRGVNFAEAATAAAQAAADRAEAYADMMQFTRVTLFYSGTGTAAPFTMPIVPDSELNLQLFVNGQRFYPGTHYTTSGNQILPTGDLDVWPVGVGNIMVLIDRPVDLAAITSEDVTHDGQPISQILDRIDAENTFYLQDYLHPDDLAFAQAGNTASQNETRVTAAVQAFHDAALGWMMGVNNRHVTLVYPNVVLAINDEMFSETWAELLWTTGGSRTNCRIVFQFNGVRFQTKNWVARAAVRTSGLYKALGITYAVPKVVFRYEARTPGNPRIETQGRIHIIGSDNPDTDPIGVKFKAINISQFDCFFFQALRNTAFYHENIFNSTFYNWQISSCGYQPTEYGGNGFIPETVRFQNVGRVVTATEPVFDASHVGRRFMLVAAAAANGQGFQTHSGVIESVDSPTQITLTAATAPFRNVTDPVVASFEAIKATTTAGSNVVTLSSPITDNLAGRYVTLFGCGQNDIAYNGKYYGAMTVVVTAHSGDQITLAHPARLSRNGIPISFGTSMIITRGAENSVIVGSMGGRTDDCTYHDARIENGSSPYDGASMMALIQHCSSTAFVGGTKFHGVSARKKNNFGANFANLGFDYATGVVLPESIMTHGGYSASAAKIIMTGGFTGVTMECDEVAFPDTTETATVLCDPTQDQIGVTLHLGNTRTDGRVGNAIKARYGDYGNAGMIVAANSAARLQRGLDLPEDDDGEDTIVGTGTTPAIPDWPTDLHDVIATGDVFATGYGSTRANAASRIAAGFWTPQNGAVYSIGGGLFEGAPGDTSVPDLPGLKGFGPFVAPEQYGAKGDGVTDDTAAMKAALRTKKTVLCRPRATYLVDDLDMQDNEHLDLNDAELRPYSSACRWLVQMRGTNTILQNGMLNDVDYVTSKTAVVTAGAAAGGTVITVDDIGEITQHMFLFVRSNTLHQWTQRRIQSISGNTITLSGAAQADIPVGATVYAGFGLVSLYHNQSDNFLNLRNLRIRRGHVGIYAKAYGGVSLGSIRTDSCQIYGQLIAGEAILGQVNNWDRISTWFSGTTENTQSATFTATAGQTTIDIGSLGFLIPANELMHENEVSIRVNGAPKLTFKNSGLPGAGQYTMSADGLTATVQPLTAGDTVQVSLFRCAITGLFIDPSGRDAGIVSGAHRFLRCSYNSVYDGAYFDSATETVGLLHLNMGVFDACRRRNMTAIHVSNFFATHLFLGYSPKPLNIQLKSGDRRMKFVGLHTERDSSGHFDQAYAASGYEVEVLCDAPADALDTHGLPKVQISPWWGPEFSINDPDGAVALGELGAKSGTYTVTIKDTAGNTSPTTVTGRWRLMDADEVQVDFDTLSGIDTTGLTAGNVARIGLPFTAAETKIGQIALTSMPSVTVTGTTTYAAFMPRVTAGDNYCTVRSFAPMGNQNGQTVANLTGANINNFSIRYRITR